MNNEIARLCQLGLTPVLLAGKRPILENWQRFQVDAVDQRDLMGPEHERPILLTPEILHAWLVQYPKSNVGVRTGRQIICLDFDDESIWPLIRDLVPRTRAVKFGARGFTLIYRQSASDPVVRSRGFVNRFTKRMMLEVLAHGRQTVLPPSIHPDTGKPYQWTMIGDWGDEPLTEMCEVDGLGSLAQCEIDAIEARLQAHGLTGAVRERGEATGRPITDADRPRYQAIMGIKLNEKLGELSGAARGGRQAALNGLCYAMSPYVREGFIAEGELEEVVRQACEVNGLLADDGEKQFSRDFYKGLTDGQHLELQALRDMSAEGLFRDKPAAMPVVAPPAPPAALNFMDAATALTEVIPPRESTGPFPHKQVSLFYGDGGAGKTTMLLQFAVACSRGEKWFGMAVEKRKVMIVSGEDENAEMRFRLSQVSRFMGSPGRADLTIVSLADDPACEETYLAIEGPDGRAKPTPLFIQLKAAVKAQGIGVLTLDPVAALYAGNQNDNVSVYSFVSLIRRHFAIECGCTVIIAAHPSASGMTRGDGTSGSVAWNNACRFRMYFHHSDDESDPDLMTLEVCKTNRGKAGAKIQCKWVEGVFVQVGSQKRTQVVDDTEPLSDPCARFLIIATSMIGNGQRLSPNPGPTYAPSMIAKHPDATGLGKRQLTHAMQRLIDSGKLSVDKEGVGTARERTMLGIPRVET